MKNVLCFGDSNTWGYNPADGSRYGHEVRWPGVLRRELGEGWHVIEEGLNGRTAAFEDPVKPGRRGLDFLSIALETHAPLDWVIFLLGTNDVKKHFNANPLVIARGMELLLKAARQWAAGARVLLIAPPPFGPVTEFAEIFEGSAEKLPGVARRYGELARSYGCEFLDAGEVVRSSEVDGVHWEAGEHEKLGRRAAAILRRDREA
jgi:lysophospholipase L1-like esterase